MSDASTQRRGPMAHVELQILMLLSRHACHGYEMMKEIPRISSGEIEPGPGTLYVALRRLVDNGRIRELSRSVHSRSRRRYAITGRGRKALEGELERLAGVLRQAESAGWTNPLGDSP